MKIAIATDHNGVKEKKEIIKYLTKKGYEMLDESEVNTPTDDYPDFAFKVAEMVKNNECDFGILLCGTGIGMSIAANKVKGVRCAHVSSIEEAMHTRNDNDANIIALSYKNNLDSIYAILDKFFSTPFSNEERHTRRINKIKNYEDTK